MAGDGKKFKCNFCSYTTNNSNSLTLHIRFHTGERPFKCGHKNCPAAFSRPGNLQAHERTHLDKEEREIFLKFQCSVCTYKTEYSGDLKKHLRTHSDVKPFSCDLCPYKSKRKNDLKIHEQCIHGDGAEIFKCPHPDCEYSAKRKRNLTRHLLVHSSDQPFACSFAECDYKTKRKEKLTHHEMTHRGEKPYKCKFCPFSATYKNNLVAHIRTHTGETPFACTRCPYRAKALNNLKEHVSNHHFGDNPGQNPFKCQHPNCESAFALNSMLKRHQLVHNKDERESLMKFKCPVCSYETMWKDSLKNHLRTHDEFAVKEFSCSFCPHKTKYKSSMRKHERRSHGDAGQTFKCPHLDCEYSAKEKRYLTIHLRVHSSDQPFACSFAQCDFKTKYEISLRRHEMTHRGEKPFKCKLCPCAFIDQSGLNRHIQNHTGETPFPCRSCSHRSKTCGDLTRHVKRCHLGQKRNQSRRAKTLSAHCTMVGCDFSARDDSIFAIHLNEIHNLPRVTLAKL